MLWILVPCYTKVDLIVYVISVLRSSDFGLYLEHYLMMILGILIPCNKDGIIQNMPSSPVTAHFYTLLTYKR